MTSSTAATPGNKPRLKEGSRPQRLAAECVDAFICEGSQDGQDGRTRNDARRAQRDLVQESRKHPNPFAFGSSWLCGLVVVVSMVQRGRCAGNGQHALQPTEASIGPTKLRSGRDEENSECVRRLTDPANRPASCAKEVSIAFVKPKVECKRTRKKGGALRAIGDARRLQGPRRVRCTVRWSQKGRSADKPRV